MSIVVGMAIGAYTPIEASLNPMITFMASVPPTAMLGLYMIIFGTHLSAYIALVAFGMFFSMVQSIAQAVQTDVSQDHIDKAYTLGASEAEVIVEVVWPQLLPRIIDAIRGQLGPAMIYIIAAEALFAAEGFGYRIKMQSRFANMDVVFCVPVCTWRDRAAAELAAAEVATLVVSLGLETTNSWSVSLNPSKTTSPWK